MAERSLATLERTWWRIGRRWPHGPAARVLTALIALVHGLARIDPLGWFGRTPVLFGDDLTFGAALVACGVLLLLSSRRRLGAAGRLAAVWTAALYAVLGAALYPASAGSAFTDAIIVVTMLNEAAAYE